LLISVLLGLAAAIAVAGIAFAAGRLTAPAATAAATNRFGGLAGLGAARNGTGNGNAFRGGFGGIGVRGTVTAIEGNQITVKLANGQEVKVQTDSSTTYHKQAAASAPDVRSGASVIVEVQPGSGFRPGASAAPTLKAADVTIAGQ
jgi:hypothetical protein